MGHEADLRMATVMASGELAQGQMTSGFRPWLWKTLRKASHDDTDPAGQREEGESHWKRKRGEAARRQESLTGVGPIGHDEHAQ